MLSVPDEFIKQIASKQKRQQQITGQEKQQREGKTTKSQACDAEQTAGVGHSREQTQGTGKVGWAHHSRDESHAEALMRVLDTAMFSAGPASAFPT